MLFRFGKSTSPLCSFCKLHDETLVNLVSSCNQVISLWIKIKLFFFQYIQLTLLSATFSLVKGIGKFFLIQNMILIVFKLYVHKSRVSGTLNFNIFLYQLVKAKNLEEGAAFINKT